MKAIDKLYQFSPTIIQNIACSIRGLKEKQIRLTGLFHVQYQWLLKSQWMEREEVESFQNRKLSELIIYCNSNIPYYKRLFKENRISPNDIKTISDLKYIPVLTKEIVRSNFSELINPKFKKRGVLSHTSGSTGKALDLLFSQEAIKYRWAIWFRHKHRFGISPNDSYATFTGKVVIPLNQKKPPFWRENYSMHQTIFTMHHLSADKIPYIVDRLNKGGFSYYTGYPSIIYSLATHIQDLGLEILAPPKVIFTGAENLLLDQRNRIAEVFKCAVTDQYGFAEGAGNASRCEFDLYHEDFEYGILECNNPIENGIYTTGEVLATGFTNLAMPLIRYEVGDTATWINTVCECGRHSKTILKVDGRNEDYVITPEGNKILRFDYIFKDTRNIKEAQVVQYKLNEITIRIIKRKNFALDEEDILKKEVREKISPLLKVNFEYPNEIQKENTGKFRAVKSYIK